MNCLPFLQIRGAVQRSTPPLFAREALTYFWACKRSAKTVAHLRRFLFGVELALDATNCGCCEICPASKSGLQQELVARSESSAPDRQRPKGASHTSNAKRSAALSSHTRKEGPFRNPRAFVEPTTGFEPVTCALRERCSTS